MNQQQLSWRAQLDRWFNLRLLDVHTSFPATITKVNDNNTVDVKPLIKTKREDGVQVDYPTIPNVRLQMISARLGEVVITMPIKAGDTVWVFISERDCSEVFNGDGQTASNASTTLTHDLSDAFAIPCFHTNSNATEIDPNNIVIRNKTTSIIVKPDGVEIETTNVSIQAEDVQIECNTFNVESETFTHNGKDVGEKHKHKDVTAGSGISGEPV